jgi:hypothetical protein
MYKPKILTKTGKIVENLYFLSNSPFFPQAFLRGASKPMGKERQVVTLNSPASDAMHLSPFTFHQ